MFQHNTDRDWEKFGQTDPYYGVSTEDQFRRENLTEAALDAFFQSGQEHVDQVMAFIRQHIDPAFTPRRVLDFGCGVGRLLIPFAKVAESVTGLDVSPSMLAEARQKCVDLPNVELLVSDDELSQLSGKFDLIHSFITFQHIPIKRGERIFLRLLDHLKKRGVCAVHFTYKDQFTYADRLNLWLRTRIPPTKYMINLLRGRSLFAPFMQMNSYNINGLMHIIQRRGVGSVYTQFFDHHHCSILLYFRAP